MLNRTWHACFILSSCNICVFELGFGNNCYTITSPQLFVHHLIFMIYSLLTFYSYLVCFFKCNFFQSFSHQSQSFEIQIRSRLSICNFKLLGVLVSVRVVPARQPFWCIQLQNSGKFLKIKSRTAYKNSCPNSELLLGW